MIPKLRRYELLIKRSDTYVNYPVILVYTTVEVTRGDSDTTGGSLSVSTHDRPEHEGLEDLY